MTYSYGQVARQQPYNYSLGHIRKKSKRLLKFLAFIIVLVALPCVGIWLAKNNIKVPTEQVSAAIPAQTPPPLIGDDASSVLAQTGPGSETNAEVQRYLHDWVNEHGKNGWAVYVEQLGSKRLLASVNADRQFELASLYKLFVLKPLSQTVPFVTWKNTAAPTNDGRTIERCVQDMLRVSDNPCGEGLAGRMGWSNLDRMTREQGYVSTKLNATDYLKGTARDTALLLKDIYTGNGYEPYVKDLVMNALGKQRYNQGIPKGCTGCTVFNKTGDANGSHHDAAVIEYEGKSYVLVIMSKGGTNKQLAELTQGILDKFKSSGNQPTGAPTL